MTNSEKSARATIRKVVRHPLVLIVIGGLLTGLLLEPYVVQPIMRLIAPAKIEITSPLDREAIQWSPTGHLATGIYSALKKEHKIYVLVHPMPTSKWYVQRVPTVINSSWQTIVYFGTTDVGVGDHYELSAIITSKSLEAEQVLENFPDCDAKYVITVKRKGGVCEIIGYNQYLHPGIAEFVTVAWEDIDTQRVTTLQVEFINGWMKPSQHYLAEDLEDNFQRLGEVTRSVSIPEDAKPSTGGHFRAMFVDESRNVVTYYETAKDVAILPKVMITSPEAGELPLSQNVPISGYASGTLPDSTLWTFIQSSQDQMYYPQAEIFPTLPSGTWSVLGWTGKGPAIQTGNKFNILVTLVDESAKQALLEYMRRSEETGVWSGLAELPSGVIVLEERGGLLGP